MTSPDSLVRDYLGRLESGLAGVPRAGRREVLDEITAHIAEARAAVPADDEIETRNVLERLGEPSEIAAEARERFGVRPVQKTWREIGALVFLSVGGFILPVVGWFIGVVLLWVSDAWSTRDKLLGALFPPSVGVLVLLANGLRGAQGGHLLLLVGVVFANFLVDGYLLVRLMRRSSLSTT